MRLLLIIVLILLLLGALPIFPHAASWGWAPAGGVGTILIVVLILFLVGVL